MGLKMIFKDERHKESFERFLELGNINLQDSERVSLFYLLALTDEVARNIKKFYNFKDNQIILEGLEEPYLTSTSRAIIRLAFNLYNSWNGDNEATPSNIFYIRSYQPYMIEALKIRFP